MLFAFLDFLLYLISLHTAEPTSLLVQSPPKRLLESVDWGLSDPLREKSRGKRFDMMEQITVSQGVLLTLSVLCIVSNVSRPWTSGQLSIRS
jgi:hypothetical protein